MNNEMNAAIAKPWYARPRITDAPEGFSGRLSQTREALTLAARYSPCVLASSLSAEDMVLFHLIATAKLPIHSFALDTGKLPAATLVLWDQIEADYECTFERVTPDATELASLKATQSDSAIYETKAARALCCDVRKTSPLRRQLAGKAAWVTGLRKAQSAGRASVPHQSWDTAFGLEKFNPLADWTDDDLWYFVDREDIPGIKGALLRYRVMAWIVGVLLAVLVLVGMPMKYINHDDTVVVFTGIPHGWLYMVLLITAYDLGRRVKWPWGRLLLIALGGTVPFMSFVAEFYATRDVKRRLAVLEDGAPMAF